MTSAAMYSGRSWRRWSLTRVEQPPHYSMPSKTALLAGLREAFHVINTVGTFTTGRCLAEIDPADVPNVTEAVSDGPRYTTGSPGTLRLHPRSPHR